MILINSVEMMYLTGVYYFPFVRGMKGLVYMSNVKEIIMTHTCIYDESATFFKFWGIFILS